MERIHLFEFEDQEWCPAFLRDALTSFLGQIERGSGQLGPVVRRLGSALQTCGEHRIVDLCSGSGGLAPHIVRGLEKQGIRARLMLSDRYPSLDSFERIAAGSNGKIGFYDGPLDATTVAADIHGMRTVFNGFHHFPPDTARSILRAAAEAGQPIAVFEFISREPWSFFGVFFAPMLLLATAPFLKPFRWQTLVFTYLIPLLPLMVLWDGVVSWLRVYSLPELRALCDSVPVPDYVWEVGRMRARLLFTVTYLIGHKG